MSFELNDERDECFIRCDSCHVESRIVYPDPEEDDSDGEFDEDEYEEQEERGRREQDWDDDYDGEDIMDVTFINPLQDLTDLEIKASEVISDLGWVGMDMRTFVDGKVCFNNYIRWLCPKCVKGDKVWHYLKKAEDAYNDIVADKERPVIDGTMFIKDDDKHLYN